MEDRVSQLLAEYESEHGIDYRSDEPVPFRRKHVDFASLIIYEDDHLLALNKPKGFTSLQDRFEGPGLLEYARRFYPGIRICHRLDKMTTGVLLFAKDDECYRNVALQFQNRTVEKHYHALVEEVLDFQDYTIDKSLGPLKNGIVRVQRENSKRAITIFNTLKTWKAHTLLDCQPITGRSHQIRVHLACVYAPIVGDTLYGGHDLLLSRLKRKYRPSGQEEPLNEGYLLHAQRLQILHPKDESPLLIEAPYYKNFLVCLKMLDKFGKVPEPTFKPELWPTFSGITTLEELEDSSVLSQENISVEES
jgi:23S rRNA pseudouridine955/2504/2580 synthase